MNEQAPSETVAKTMQRTVVSESPDKFHLHHHHADALLSTDQ